MGPAIHKYYLFGINLASMQFQKHLPIRNFLWLKKLFERVRFFRVSLIWESVVLTIDSKKCECMNVQKIIYFLLLNNPPSSVLYCLKSGIQMFG